MAEPATTDTTTAGTGDGAATPPPAPSTSDATRLPDDHPLVKAFQATKTELAATRAKVKEFEDKDKSELERLTDDRDAHKTRAEQAEVELARHRAALKHGLSADDLDLLGTGTPDEIEQRAERLAKRLAGQATDDTVVPDLGQGPRGKAPKAQPLGQSTALAGSQFEKDLAAKLGIG